MFTHKCDTGNLSALIQCRNIVQQIERDCFSVAKRRSIYIYIYIYIYDVSISGLLGAPYIYIYEISSLRVNYKVQSCVLCLKWFTSLMQIPSHLYTFVHVVEPNVISLISVFPQLKLTTHYNCQPSALMLTARLKLSSSAYLKQATSKCNFLLRQKQLLRYNMSVYIPN